MEKVVGVGEVEFVKELYPRLKEDPGVISQYRAAIDKLPPIVLARGHILVDGYHRWQAHKLEGKETISAIDLGNITDIQIVKESLIRNAAHGYQLNVADKKRNADRLYRMLDGSTNNRYEQIAELLSITPETARKYCQAARQDEKAEQQARAWDLWLDCWTQEGIAEEIGVPQRTISDWLSEFGTNSIFAKVPGSTDNNPWGNVQHFDVWNFHVAGNEGSYFGKMPSQVVENLLWLFTEPGQTVFDPFAGSGTTINVAKSMGRRVWASDRKPVTPMLPIHEHDILTGWPEGAPGRPEFILLDPPYWMQAKGRYSNDPADMGNMLLNEFYDSWGRVVETCKDHMPDNGHLAFITSPAEDMQNQHVEDLAFNMYRVALNGGLKLYRRIIVTYNTQQATGQQVNWARENKRLLKLYRDLVVFRK